MPKHKIFRALGEAFQSGSRYRTILPDPLNAASPWYFTAGPVFNPGADAAILNSKYSKPWQVWQGYAYRVANPQKFTPLQPSQLFAPKGVPTVGINIQLGYEGVTSPSVNSDGTYANEGIFAYSQGAAPNHSESEW